VRISPAEGKRKLVHLGVGLFAFALRFLSWPAAAGAALAAVLFNLFAMPRIGRGIYRDAARHRDPGIVAYPATVLLLVVLFRHRLEIAAAIWAMMAAGDPAASVVGRLLGGPRLAWNRDKTWTGLAAYALAGGGAMWVLYGWTLQARVPGASGPGLATIAAVSCVAAFLESYPTGFDDNWVPPIPAGLLLYASLFALPAYAVALPNRWLVALAVNAVIAAASAAAGIVSGSGAVAGGIAGTAVLALAGWGGYAVLWGFFLFGTLATRLGYAEKERRGTAQARRGRRGARHVAANCSVGVVLAALLCAIPGRVEPLAPTLLGAAFAASFAAALADTLGTEIGSLSRGAAYSMAAGTRVPTGTRGAVSVAGTLGGLAGAFLLAVLAAVVGLVPPFAVPAVTAAGLAGSLAESLLHDLGARRGIRVDHDFANAFNTAVGAAFAIEILLTAMRGRFFVPFEEIRRAVAP
jgi:uncharacterized protein (TIGR00297 family)